MPPKDPCQKQACAIQRCLQANNYNDRQCKDVIQDMRRCCEDHSAKTSICCSGFRKEIMLTKDKTDQTALK